MRSHMRTHIDIIEIYMRSQLQSHMRKKALSQLEPQRRRYLGASSEEGAISARAAKKALSRHELRRRRYLKEDFFSLIL